MPLFLHTLFLLVLQNNTGTAARLFQFEQSISSVNTRIFFCYSFENLRSINAVTLADELRMAGLLVHWLVDVVESPPHRPGATPEENADEYLFWSCRLAEALQKTALALLRNWNHEPVVPSLPRPAQSAWRRLTTQHLPRLPRAARLLLSLGVVIMAPDDTVQSIFRALVPDVMAVFVSGNFMINVGRGVLHSIVASTALFFFAQNGFLDNDLRTLFSGPFSGLPRRLTVLLHREVLLKYEPQRRAFQRDCLAHVSL
jgi:hypothetical protein